MPNAWELTSKQSLLLNIPRSKRRGGKKKRTQSLALAPWNGSRNRPASNILGGQYIFTRLNLGTFWSNYAQAVLPNTVPNSNGVWNKCPNVPWMWCARWRPERGHSTAWQRLPNEAYKVDRWPLATRGSAECAKVKVETLYVFPLHCTMPTCMARTRWSNSIKMPEAEKPKFFGFRKFIYVHTYWGPSCAQQVIFVAGIGGKL